MSDISELDEETKQSNTGLIYRVVMHCNEPGSIPDIEEILHQAEENGWNRLVEEIRHIMAGKRDESILDGLDLEERYIIGTILKGLEDVTTLPNMSVDFSSELAAPGIAHLIHSARAGSQMSLNILSAMSTQMFKTGGDLAVLGSRIRPLIEGERDVEKLSEGMEEAGSGFLHAILTELSSLEGQ